MTPIHIIDELYDYRHDKALAGYPIAEPTRAVVEYLVHGIISVTHINPVKGALSLRSVALVCVCTCCHWTDCGVHNENETV